MPVTAAPPQKYTLRETLKALGISRATYYRGPWSKGVFTAYRTDGGDLRFCKLEVDEASQHTDPSRGRAVLRLRKAMGRLAERV